MNSLHPGTVAVHAGQQPDPATGAVAPPIHLATTFRHGPAGERLGGYEYQREGNPTNDRLREALAALEGGATALTFASGMAAMTTLLESLPAGSRVLFPDDCYSGLRMLFSEFLPERGLHVETVDMGDLDAVRVPYDAATKKARSRRIFEGSKWLELGYNPKDLWSISRLHRQDPERVDHPTQKPLHIIERMVLASCPPGGLVLDPFMGSGTTAVACALHGRRFVGFELNAHYHALANQRLQRLSDHVPHSSDVPSLASAG